jgi:hypothetical protein
MPRNPLVDEFLSRVTHPQQGTIEKIRDTILGVDDRIAEAIALQGPTFFFGGTIATILMRTNSYAQLLFPHGALLRDPTGLLEGSRRDVRCIRFQSIRDVEKNRSRLEGLIREWITLRSALEKPQRGPLRRMSDQQ